MIVKLYATSNDWSPAAGNGRSSLNAAWATFLLCAAAVSTLSAQTPVMLFSFDGADGQFPGSRLVQATNGDLYGTTYGGGANSYGTVFRITPSGALTRLYSFCAQSECADGGQPVAALVQATNGGFYGTTLDGGDHGGGTVFKITPKGALTTLYSFCAQSGCADGSTPYSYDGLVQATDGYLYGTTYTGGAYGGGTVYRITPGGTLTTLYSFCSKSACADGEKSTAGLLEDTNGYLYGTTLGGGVHGNYGTIFRITPGGALKTLYSFCAASGCSDGANPYAGLAQGSDGGFYGTTFGGGANNAGTVFKITASGKLTTLYSFCFPCTEGANPLAAVLPATDGNLYGTTANGGANSRGTIFKIALNGALTPLYSFCAKPECSDGATPYGALIQDTNGALYGTTSYGGTYDSCILVGSSTGCGNVFSLSIDRGPFVETLPISGEVGAAVKILGSDLTGATSVTFNGTPQPTFTVVSRYLITTTVPAAATTGKVEVVIPSRTLSSNVPFRVLP